MRIRRGDRSRLHAGDLLRVGSTGLRARRLRSSLSAVGIAIGIAAMVGVLGLSASSKADLIAQLDRLGTNLLTVTPGKSLAGEVATLPAEATRMIGRIDGVEGVAAVAEREGTVPAVVVRRLVARGLLDELMADEADAADEEPREQEQNDNG